MSISKLGYMKNTQNTMLSSLPKINYFIRILNFFVKKKGVSFYLFVVLMKCPISFSNSHPFINNTSLISFNKNLLD
jgi:hypothetical protein